MILESLQDLLCQTPCIKIETSGKGKDKHIRIYSSHSRTPAVPLYLQTTHTYAPLPLKSFSLYRVCNTSEQ